MIDKSATLFAAGDVGGLLDLNHTRFNNLANVLQIAEFVLS